MAELNEPSKALPPVTETPTGVSTDTPTTPEPTTKEEKKKPNFVVKGARWFRDKLAFKTTYNATLFFLFGGALLGFSLSRLPLLALHTYYRDNAAPGEYYLALTKPLFRISMILHLAFVLPGAFLAVFQFIPLIRYRALIFHRVNGYLVLLLLTAGTIPGFLLSPHAFGGHISTASGGITIGVGTLVSLGMAYYNIKLLQIDQHRKWMLRAMVYMSAIITSRMMLGIGMAIMTSHPAPPFEVWPCGQLEWTVRDSDREVSHAAFVKTYPTCTGKDKFAMARAGDYGVEGFGSALRISFGTGLWIAMVLHAVGAEVYIRLTAGESERLRVVSWERQMERGWKNAGSVGSTGDRWGDAPKWVPERVGLVEK